MKRVFILEDDPERITQFREVLFGTDLTLCTDAHVAKKLWEPPYDIVCLDHDLGGETYVDPELENTGTAFAKFLCSPVPEASLLHTPIVVHSFNYEAGLGMVLRLKETGYVKTIRVPFGPKLLKALKEFAHAEK